MKIGFGIMGGFNQAQAHAQFVANIVDYGMDVQQALEAGRFTKVTFEGCDVNVEALVPAQVRSELTALGHKITVVPPRSGTFGYGQAVMSDGTGVHYAGSEPRHDGAAIPEAPPVFKSGRGPLFALVGGWGATAPPPPPPPPAALLSPRPPIRSARSCRGSTSRNTRPRSKR